MYLGKPGFSLLRYFQEVIWKRRWKVDQTVQY